MGLMGVPAFGQILDPEVLHIGTGLGTPCQAGEPASLVLFGTGLLGLSGFVVRRRSTKTETK